MPSIQDVFVSLLEERVTPQVLPATVKSVAGRTCTVELPSGLVAEDVKLMADEQGGVLVKPKGGSSVLVALIGNTLDNLMVVGYSVIDSYTLDIQGKFKIKNQNESLKAILVEMITQMEQLTVATGAGVSTQPINKPAINSIKTKINHLLNDD